MLVKDVRISDVFPTCVGVGRIMEPTDHVQYRFSPHAWGWAVGLLLYVVELMSFPHMRGGGSARLRVYTSVRAVFPTCVGVNRRSRCIVLWYYCY